MQIEATGKSVEQIQTYLRVIGQNNSRVPLINVDGSFGNQLLVTIQPVNSANRAFTYQYANITVYKADFYEVTKPVSGGYSTEKVIKSVPKLESHLVTTNPYDVNYFEDVEFDFKKQFDERQEKLSFAVNGKTYSCSWRGERFEVD